MITVYAFEPGLGMPSSSPFVVKTMVHLAMAKQPYEIEVTFDLRSAPKGKLPYIRDGEQTIADSEFIRAHLETRYGADFDPGLTPEQKADGIAFSRLAEDHLHWCGLYDHWQVDENWAMMKPLFFGSLPPDQRDVIADAARDQVRRDMHGQGLGRHRPDELLALAKSDLQALDQRLGDHPFWFGETLTSADAAIAPQIQIIASDPLGCPLNKALSAYPRLTAYAKRVLDTALPERMASLAA